MHVTSIKAICALCGQEYEAPSNVRAYRGLCPAHWSSDTLREWDRLDSTRAHLKLSPGTPDDLTLAQWMAIISNHRGKCALCQQVQFSRLSIWIPANGFTAHNVIPTCKACEWHRVNSWHDAIDRVNAQLVRMEDGNTTTI